MTCENCKARVISTLLSVDEVESVDVIKQKYTVNVPNIGVVEVSK